ncbi:MAG TPA: isoprenylcysteine carboxylmethyltransferase family protein [Streptosporangiaceae bacterium]|nr:isoprenylcysteine carboxylmethyltransferase family protein [Streptosporangiaceae bacterium]
MTGPAVRGRPPRWVRWLVAVYPRAWRARYGSEVSGLTGELLRAGDTTPRRAALDLLGGAVAERGGRTASLVIRNVVFTLVIPGLGGAWLPWRILSGQGHTVPVAWEATVVIAAGTALYGWCVWNFAAVGRGTPGPWDAPRRVVAAGPYRFVRNPIYIAALLVVGGEAWLFGSPRLLAYAGVMALTFHLFVTGYEERRLSRSFGGSYQEYRRAVPRWIPRPPRHA